MLNTEYHSNKSLRWQTVLPCIQRMGVGIVSLALMLAQGAQSASFGPSPLAHQFMMTVLGFYIVVNGLSCGIRLRKKQNATVQIVETSVSTWSLDFAVLASGLVFAPQTLFFFAPLLVFMSLVLGLQRNSSSLVLASLSGLLFVWLLGLYHPYWSHHLEVTEALILAFALVPFIFFQICQSFEFKTKQLEAQLYRDELTGLKNRRALRTDLELSAQKGLPLTLVFVDLDRFKLVNDTLGHQEGDSVLKGSSLILQRVFSRDDEVYRLSGDEFVVLCNGLVPETRAQALSRELNAGLRTLTDSRGLDIGFGACLGFCAVPSPTNSSSAQLMSNADSLMYRAKEAGRGGFAYQRLV